MSKIGRKGAEWARARDEVLRGATFCAMPDCKFPGVPLNPDDIVNGRPGPLYPTADHLICVSWTEGWSDADRRAALHDPRYLRPAHNACNAARGARSTRQGSGRVRPTRDWGV